MNSRFFAFLLLLSLSINLFALPQDHDVILPISGSVMQEYSKYDAFGSFDFRWVEAGRSQQKKVEGNFWHLKYKIFKDGEIAADMTENIILGNYLAAAKQKDGKILSKGTYDASFMLEKENGGEIWVSVYSGGGGEYELTIVEPAVLESDLIFGAEQIRDELLSEGFIVLNGILFDTGKAFLQPKSIKALNEVTKMLRAHADMWIEIQGHTDNIGQEADNQELSERRANTVYEFLLLFGIAKNRLVTKGLGETKPIADNDSEEGRKRNRRVELHRM